MKKLLNKKGSVLFLVVVVMSILLVVASATYYIVSNQRQSVEVHYNSEQSYQTAYSVSQNVSQYISNTLSQIDASKGDVKKVNGGNNIVAKMLGLNDASKPGAVNTTLTSNDVDLKALGMGEFNVEIKKIKVDGDTQYFEITTKATSGENDAASYNGESTTITEVISITVSEQIQEYFTRFLTCTGDGHPDDVIFGASNIYGVTYFENDFTRLMGQDIVLHESLYASGTFSDEGVVYDKLDPSKYSEVVIGGNYILTTAAGSAVTPTCVFVGGDMIVTNQKPIKAKEVYVYGDLTITTSMNDSNTVFYVHGDMYCYGGADTKNNTFYIDGNLYLGEDPGGTHDSWYQGEPWYNSGTFYVAKDVHVVGTTGGAKKVEYGGQFIRGKYLASWWEPANNNFSQNAGVSSTISEAMSTSYAATTRGPSLTPAKEMKTWSNIKDYISASISTNEYYTWDAQNYFETDPRFNSAPKIDLNNTNQTFIQNVNGGYIATINQSCTITPITMGGWGNYCIIFDATDEDLYVYLDSDGYKVNGRDTFTFFTNISAGNVLVKGTHSVIFILPVGTDYKSAQQSFIGHYDLAKKIVNDSSFNGLGVSIVGKIVSGDQYKAVLGDSIFKTEKVIETDENGKTYERETERFLDKSKFGPGSTVHNNIFLVTRGNSEILDFDIACTFCGYIYAPNESMSVYNSYGVMQFFGGLIVGNYYYKNQSAILVFCTPYDDNNGEKENVVSKLMQECGVGGGGGGNGSNNKKVISDHGSLGYK